MWCIYSTFVFRLFRSLPNLIVHYYVLFLFFNSEKRFGNSFRKSLRKSQPIREEEEITADVGLKEEELEAASLRRDSTETESEFTGKKMHVIYLCSFSDKIQIIGSWFVCVSPCVCVYVCADSPKTPALNMTSVGLDTVEEEEAGAPSTIDYSKLNRDLDSTSSTIATNLRYESRGANIISFLQEKQFTCFIFEFF